MIISGPRQQRETRNSDVLPPSPSPTSDRVKTGKKRFIWQFYTNHSFDKESSLALLDLCYKWKSILKLCSSSAPLHHWCPVKYLSAWKWKHICPGSTFHIFHAFTPPGKSSPPFLELRHVGLERDGIDRLEEPHQLLPQHPALLLSSAKAVHRGVKRHHLIKIHWISVKETTSDHLLLQLM